MSNKFGEAGKEIPYRYFNSTRGSVSLTGAFPAAQRGGLLLSASFVQGDLCRIKQFLTAVFNHILKFGTVVHFRRKCSVDVVA